MLNKHTTNNASNTTFLHNVKQPQPSTRPAIDFELQENKQIVSECFAELHCYHPVLDTVLCKDWTTLYAYVDLLLAIIRRRNRLDLLERLEMASLVYPSGLRKYKQQSLFKGAETNA